MLRSVLVLGRAFVKTKKEWHCGDGGRKTRRLKSKGHGRRGGDELLCNNVRGRFQKVRANEFLLCCSLTILCENFGVEGTHRAAEHRQKGFSKFPTTDMQSEQFVGVSVHETRSGACKKTGI